MSINLATARTILLAEAENAAAGSVNAGWQKDIEHFSDVCETSTLTHVAFLGTALLAKSTDIDADVWSVKAGDEHPGAYSTRSLCHGVIVPEAVRLGINLGVTGREPLNNQPYFQITRLSRKTTVHAKAKPALHALCDLLEKAAKFTTTAQGRAALRAFIYVRRQRNPMYGTFTRSKSSLSVSQLISRIETFVSENAEGGKRAQAVAAALLDGYAGKDRVSTSRVNDPSKHAPGDVNVHYAHDPEKWESVFEVRDKPIKESDMYAFAEKAIKAGAHDAGMLVVSGKQPQIDSISPIDWAADRGLALILFMGWKGFIEQLLFWSPAPSLATTQAIPKLIFDRLVELEVSKTGTDRWRELNN